MQVTYYDNKGIPFSDEKDASLYTAKHVTTENLNRFFLKTASGSLIDARNLSDYEIKNLKSLRYKEVPENVFDLYIKYLKTKTNSSLRSIERLLA